MNLDDLNDKTRQVFRVEAEELLAELEASLLALENDPTEPELLNRAFRALHTLKGSGATCGFASLSGFLHRIEDVFSLARDRAITVDSALIDLTLELRDVIEHHVRAAPDLGEEILRGAQPLLQRFLQYLPAKADDAAPPLPDEDRPVCRYRIHFAPLPDFFRFGHDPRALFAELRELDPEARFEADLSQLPLRGEFDPEACHLSWEIVLRASVTPEELQEVFLFVEDECELAIEPISATADTPLGAREAVRQAAASPGPRGTTRAAADTMRVAAEKLDRLVDMVGELVILRSQVTNACDTMEEVPTELSGAAEALQRLTGDLRDLVLDVRTMPIGDTFAKFHRTCRDLSRDLGKKVELRIDGGETAMDKTVLEQLRDPLMHLVRNAIDHGVESPSERAAAGKPPIAHLRLGAEQRGDRVWITVSDDGRGIDPRKVRAKGIAKGLLTAESKLSDEEVQQLVLQPGFSTAETVSEVSGRGVGLDVVKRQIDFMRGTIHLRSRPGEGTTIQLSVPLTLAIIDGLLVRLDQDHYVFPLSAARETIELTAHERGLYNGRNLVELRGELLPYLDLRRLFDYPTPPPSVEKVVIVEMEDERLGLVVDEVIGHYQTVLKTLGWLGRQLDVFSGATVLANGHIGLICDLPGLLRLSEAKGVDPATVEALEPALVE
jgi:two-component system, chemotaxis family, sensor kinase CheA